MWCGVGTNHILWWKNFCVKLTVNQPRVINCRVRVQKSNGEVYKGWYVKGCLMGGSFMKSFCKIYHSACHTWVAQHELSGRWQLRLIQMVLKWYASVLAKLVHARAVPVNIQITVFQRMPTFPYPTKTNSKIIWSKWCNETFLSTDSFRSELWWNSRRTTAAMKK